MAAQRVHNDELFNAYRKIDSVKELLELTKMSDDELYSTLGSAARASMAIHPERNVSGAASEPGDYTARDPFFFKGLKDMPMTAPSISIDLPDDPVEAGRTVFNQLSASFDKIVCRMVKESPLLGYKQELMTLGMQCYEALEKEFPTMSRDLLKSFVALRTKGGFNSCSRL